MRRLAVTLLSLAAVAVVPSAQADGTLDTIRIPAEGICRGIWLYREKQNEQARQPGESEGRQRLSKAWRLLRKAKVTMQTT